MLPLLQRIVDTHADAAIKQTATDVRVLIATYGRVSVNSVGNVAETSKNSSVNCMEEADGGAASQPKRLIEVISSSKDPVTEQSSLQSSSSEFQTAMTEVADILVPVRGHALLTLRRLVDSGDTTASNSIDKVLAVCEKTIDDPDSYVYLNSIQLLTSLVARFPQQTLPWLADKYLSVSGSEPAGVGCQQSIAERRMKIGEVMVKASSVLGMAINN